MKLIHTLGFLGLLLFFGGLVHAEGAVVELPSGAVNGDTTNVLWIDVEGTTPELIRMTRSAVEAALPPESARSGAIFWSCVADSQKALEVAGARTVVIAMYPKSLAPDQKTAPATEPSTTMETEWLFSVKPGVDPDQFAASLRELIAKECKAANQPIPPDLDTLQVKPLAKDWVYVSGPDVVALRVPVAGQDDPVLALFNKSLNRNNGAAVRFAFRMTDATRTELKAQSLNAPLLLASLGELMRDVTSLDDADAGLFLGEKPRVGIMMHFPDADTAAAFKKTLNDVVNSIAMLTQLGSAMSDDPAAKAQMQAMRTALVPLLMTQRGADLTTSIDTIFVKTLTDLNAKAATSRRSDPNQ